MKTATFSVVAMASVAAAIPMCAINCFTQVITDYPPLDCTEPDMYHCFCKIPSLQQHFLDCAYTGNQCASEAEGSEAVAFGVDLCSQLGLPITIDTKPPTQQTTTPPAETTQPPAETTAEPEPTDNEPEPTAEPTAEPTDGEPKPSGSSGSSSGSSKPTGTGSGPTPSGTSGVEPPIVVGAANAKAVSGLLAAAGLVAALI